MNELKSMKLMRNYFGTRFLNLSSSEKKTRHTKQYIYFSQLNLQYKFANFVIDGKLCISFRLIFYQIKKQSRDNLNALHSSIKPTNNHELVVTIVYSIADDL